jgi:YVTN family beta-propeller protein
VGACKDNAGPAAPNTTHPAGVIAQTVQLDGRPFGVAISSLGAYHVVLLDVARIGRGNLPTRDFTATVSVGAVPTAVAFHPSGMTSYVTNQLDKTLGIVDVGANTQVNTISLQGFPFVVAVSPNGSTVYCTDNEGRLYAVDAGPGALRRTVTLTGTSNGLVFHPNSSRAFATIQFRGEIAEITTNSDQVARVLNVGGGVVQGIAISADGSELYVGDEVGGELRVISVASGSVIAIVDLAGGAFDVKLSPDDAQLYVSLPSSGAVQVVDRASRTVIRTINTGGAPRRIAFSALGETAIVANESGWVDFIQ